MDSTMIDTHLENLDRRLARVEQILPTLATKEDLTTLATKEELKTLATKEELRAEHERSRLDMRMLIEHQDSKLELLAEHLLSLRPKPTEE